MVAFGGHRPGCGMAEMYDLDDVENRDKEVPTCFDLRHKQEPYFKLAFRNKDYDVLQLIKQPRVT